MKKGQIILTLTLSLCAASVAWAQDEQQPAPSPVPAFGQENPTPPVSENPPISAIDQPGLEPHAAPESFLLPGLHFSESADSNVGNQLGGSALSSVTRGLGTLALQRLWQNYDVAADYIGGVAYYDQKGVGLEQLQQLDLDNRINWKRGQLAIRDSFSYLPEGVFGFGAYGGGGAYGSGLGGLSTGLIGGSAFGGQSNAFLGGSGVSVGQLPRLTNLGLADVVETLTPKSSVTLSIGYGLVHFYGDVTSLAGTQENVSFIGSAEYSAQFGYDRILSAKDQVAVSYGYQGFEFSTVDTGFHTNVIQGLYGHRISGRMDFLISAGPQFTELSPSSYQCDTNPLATTLAQCPTIDGVVGQFIQTHQSTSHVGVAGRMSLRYRFPRTSVSLSFQRYDTSGSGVYAGAESNIAHLDMDRPLGRVWDMFADLGYAQSKRLQIPGSAVSASSFSYGYVGVGLHRQLSRSLRAFVSYQFNELGFSSDLCPNGFALIQGTCVPLSSSGGGGTTSVQPVTNLSQRQVGTIGIDWTPRPIRLD